MLQKLSEITGSLSPAHLAEKPIGPRPGVTGSVATVTAVRAVEWLLAQPSVAGADKALRTSLQSSLGVTVSVEREGRFPEGRPAYYVSTGCRLTVTDPDHIPAAIAKIEAAMTPGTREQCEAWLVMLQAALNQGKRSQASALVALELYAGALSRYPADVAKRVCETLATRPRKGGAWFPSLPELIEELDNAGMERASLLASLKAWRQPSESDRLSEDAREWSYLAVKADGDAISCRNYDPDRSSEASEFAAFAHQEAKRLRIASHQAKAKAKAA